MAGFMDGPGPYAGPTKILVDTEEEALAAVDRYADLGYKEGSFPVSEKAARECLSLPIYPELTDAQIQRVVDVIKDFFKKN